MAVRYISRRHAPKRAFDNDEDLYDLYFVPDSITVHENEDDSEETGLLDSRGNPLYRVTERNKIGFKT